MLQVLSRSDSCCRQKQSTFQGNSVSTELEDDKEQLIMGTEPGRRKKETEWKGESSKWLEIRARK